MPIESGTTLLHYTLVDKLGEGGMGAVWRATDNTLRRDVAIKLLPQVFADDGERLARFEREATTLASLNHPNIAAVYGLHETDSSEGRVRFLSMELVEGEDLSKVLDRGRLSVDRVLDYAVQMAAGIEAAHEKGVVHRDLKPANAIVTPEGHVKLLDFGLAKAFENDPAGSDPSFSPTMTSAGTVAGVILGTAAYMSPEQARGKPVDRRADLWSFGCVLYECLTGIALFAGETVSDSLAAILRKDPDWSKLPDDTPPMVRLLLKRCLTRDPAKRLRDAGDAKLELEAAIEDPTGASLGLAAPRTELTAEQGPAPRKQWLPWALAGLAAILALVFALGGSDPSPRDASARRLTIPITAPTVFGDSGTSPPVVSPDGRWVVYGMADDGGKERLWLRPMDSFETRPLDGTEGANYAFWAPDSRHVGFFLGGNLKRIEVSSGRVQTIGSGVSTNPRGASWGDNDRVLFVPNSNTGVWVIEASGGEARQITTPDPDMADASHRWPHFLPDGDHFLYLVWTNDLEALQRDGGVYVASISGETEPTRVIADTSSMVYAPSGHLLVMQDDNLLSIPFDTDALEVRGESSVIASGVLSNRNNGHAAFSVSDEGTLVYARGVAAVPPATFVWIDRDGTEAAVPVEPTPLMSPLVRLSPDATRAVATMPGTTGDSEVWVIDLLRGVRTRLTPPAPFSYVDPLWSADGTRVMYTTLEAGQTDLVVRNADGSGAEEPFLRTARDKQPQDWSRDGKRVLYWYDDPSKTSLDIYLYDRETEETTVIIDGDPEYVNGRFSPDGRYLAYSGDDSGNPEIFVQSIETGARWQASIGGGALAHWRDDGRELVYLDPDNRLMAVDVTLGANQVTLGRPRELFATERTLVGFDANLDHTRFLFAFSDRPENDPLHVVLNWSAGLE